MTLQVPADGQMDRGFMASGLALPTTRLFGDFRTWADLSEGEFREILDTLPVAIYTTDADGRLTGFNRACVEFSGRTPQLGSDHWCVTWKLFHPDGSPMRHDECPMAISLQEKRPIRGKEAIAERPDGSRIWFEPYPTPIFDAAGELVGGVNMLVDITERKNTEQISSRLAAIVESSDDAIVTKDLSGIITSWNAGAERLFGYTAEEAIGRPGTILMPPDRRNEEPDILDRVRCGERVDHYETVRRRKDGTLVDISLTVSPVRDSQGRVIGASKVARDITGRKQAERALRDRQVWVDGQREAAEAAINGASLETSLGILVRTAIEGVGQGARAAFYLANAEGTALHHVVGMPPDYAEAVDGFKIGPDSLSCGLATATGKPVLTADVHHEPLWKPWLWMAEKFDFCACWSFPIHTAARRFAGTLAIYSREPREATERDQELASLLTDTASIIIARHQEAEVRNQAEAALRKSEEHLELISNTVPALISYVDTDGRYQTCNEAYTQWFGLRREEIIGRPMREVLGEQAWKIVGPHIETALGGKRVEYEAELKYQRGGARWIHAAYSPNFNEQRTVIGVVVLVTDITALKKSEESLRASEERFRMLADNMSQLAWTCDQLGDVTWYNKRWLDYTGLSFDEMKKWGWTQCHHPDHVDRVVASVTKSRETGEIWEDTFPLRGKDGEYRWFLSRAYPIRNEAGEIVRWFGTNTDITEQRLQEERLRVLMAELNHRVKNTLATVEAVARQTMDGAESLESFAESFGTRLRSMAAAHSLLTRSEWAGAELLEILNAELKARVASPESLTLRGPRVMIEPQSALALHMAVHELATNAAKYGALSTAGGHLLVQWEITSVEKEQRLAIEWKETGGPQVAPPRKHGFGHQMISQVLEYELDGSVECSFETDGLRCRISFPLRGLAHAAGERV